jgi:HK97 family phage major capsid protein
MTMPPSLPVPPASDSSAFRGTICPPDVQAQILNLLVENAAFAWSLTQLRTQRGSMAFPTAAPSGAAWVGELDKIPLMSLNDDALTVGLAKLAGLVDVSNESVSDSVVNLTAQLTMLLRDSLSKQLDDGLLYGSGPPEPAGVIASAPPAQGATLLEAVAVAKGGIADAGGTPRVLAMSGTGMAAADTATDVNGQLIYPGGFGPALGLAPVVVPGLTTPLVYDSQRVFCVVNGDLSSVDMSTDFRFEYDATTFRIKSRVTCAVPAPQKSIRKLIIGPPGGATTGKGKGHT